MFSPVNKEKYGHLNRQRLQLVHASVISIVRKVSENEIAFTGHTPRLNSGKFEGTSSLSNVKQCFGSQFTQRDWICPRCVEYSPGFDISVRSIDSGCSNGSNAGEQCIRFLNCLIIHQSFRLVSSRDVGRSVRLVGMANRVYCLANAD